MPGVRNSRMPGVSSMFGRWRQWWHRHCAQETGAVKPVNGKGAREAQAALAEARADLRHADELSAEAQPHIATLKRINEENHFASWAWQVFERGGSK